METAPLNHAHTHARNASLETKRSNPVAASEEHDLAAAEFAVAAQSSSDHEATRILNLLEQHHKKLGAILRSAHENPTAEEPSESTSPDASKGDTTSSKPPRLARTPRESTRELSSSIASNLATARGIPGARHKRSLPVSPLVSNQHADGQLAQDTTRPRSTIEARSTSKPSWTPPLNTAEEKKESPGASDSPFQLFYNTFEGLISKMSAPLAFAGLPLAQIPDGKPPASAQPPHQPPQPTKKDQSMDYSRLISNAAFRAVSTNPSAQLPARRLEDSFYHVPTAGGTISYAEMVNRADREEARTFRHHRQLSNLSSISEDDFVDASSTILAQQATTQAQTNRPNRRGATNERKVDGKTMEELALENAALKHISDTLSRRLHVFEMSSQTSTAALAQSIRSMPRSPTEQHSRSSRKQPPTSQHSAGREKEKDTDDQTSKRIAELEDILRKSDARVKKRDAENERLRETIGKYKDKWDSLKAGAKARRERQQGEAVASGPGGGQGGPSRRDSENNIVATTTTTTTIAEEE